MTKPIAALLGSVCLCILVALAPSLRGSSSVGAAVQSSEYDTTTGITTVHIVNTSHKEISALDLSLQVTFPDRSVSRRGGSSFGIDFLEGIIQGKGGFEPGAVFSQEIRGLPGPAQAAIDLVVYSDGTADVLNQGAFNEFAADRKARVRALQRVNDLLNSALADSAIQHPSATVVGQIRSLVAAIKQQEHSDAGAGGYGSELQTTMQNLTNLLGSPRLTEPAFEGNQLRALIKTHQDRISGMLPHTELVKAVRP